MHKTVGVISNYTHVKKLILLLLLIVFGIQFYQCSLPDDTSVIEIRNNSSEDLTVRLFFEGEQLDPQTFIESGKKTPIHYEYFYHKTLTQESPCINQIDSFSVIVSNDKRLKINILDESNWISNFNSHRNHNTQNCTLVVTDDDLE